MPAPAVKATTKAESATTGQKAGDGFPPPSSAGLPAQPGTRGAACACSIPIHVNIGLEWRLLTSGFLRFSPGGSLYPMKKQLKAKSRVFAPKPQPEPSESPHSQKF